MFSNLRCINASSTTYGTDSAALLTSRSRLVVARVGRVLDDSYLRNENAARPAFDADTSKLSSKPNFAARARKQAARGKQESSAGHPLLLIKHASSLEQLLGISAKHDIAASPELLTTYVSKLSQIATSTYTLSQLPNDPTYQDILLSLLPIVSKHSASLDAPGLAVLILSLGRLRLRDRQLVSELLLHVQLKLHLFNDQNTSNLLHGLALLQHAHPPELTTALLHHSSYTFYMYQPQAFSNTIHALAKLNITPPADWTNSFLQHTAPQLPSFTPQNLCNTIWALAKLRIRPHAHWNACLLAASRQLLPTFKPIDLANVLWSLANLGVRPDKPWMAAFCTCVQLQMDGFGSLATSTALYGMAKLRHKPDEQLLAVLLPHLCRHIRSYPANQAADVVRSLAMMGVAPGEELTGVVREMLGSGVFDEKLSAGVERSLSVMAKSGSKKK